jgi:quercetin dioxygenase-like cupin family protein
MSKHAGAQPGVDYLMVDRSQLAASELEGRYFGGANASLFLIDLGPGEGPRLHRHPYQEIFIVLEGHAKYTVGLES